MVRIHLCVCVGLFFCAASTLSTRVASAQDSAAGQQLTLRQTRADVAGLPESNFGSTASLARTTTTVTPTNTSFYRQASAQSGVYAYPANSQPRSGGASQSNYALSRNVANASSSNQMTAGSSLTNVRLAARTQFNNQAPTYSLNPTPNVQSQLLPRPGSRSPVEQQVSSTMPQRQNVLRQNFDTNGQVGATTVQQAQVQAMQLASQAQAQQALAQQTLAQAQYAQARAAQLAQASQPTTAFRQTVFQQSTLGLGGPQARLAQNCCAPGYNPAAINPTAAAYQTPLLNPNVGSGLAVPPLNIQVPGQTGYGQAYAQPNYQLAPGVGTPQFGAQGARWWTPFVSGSGVYTPLIRLQNMPVGTYLGQGIIGQPTAYVDGQPVRNLLRYVSP